jgi:hypothetical protein
MSRDLLLMKYVFEFAGGQRHGLRTSTDDGVWRGDHDENDLALAFLWMSNNGELGRCFTASTDEAMWLLRKHGSAEVRSRGFRFEHYQIVERLEQPEQILLRVQCIER